MHVLSGSLGVAAARLQIAWLEAGLEPFLSRLWATAWVPPPRVASLSPAGNWPSLLNGLWDGSRLMTVLVPLFVSLGRSATERHTETLSMATCKTTGKPTNL